MRRLTELGIEVPTEIQSRAIPLLLGKPVDLIGQAQTGTGKTAAFGLPLVQKVHASKDRVQAIVLAPTRELAKQIGKQLFRFTKYADENIFTEVVCGGEDMDEQIRRLKRPTHIIVATPGRLNELLQKHSLDISRTTMLVLDECDEMLSMGFKDQIDVVCEATRARRSTWLFSATMPEGIERLIQNEMAPDAEQIQIGGGGIVNRNIRHRYVSTSNEDRFEAIVDFLETQGEERGVIFCRMRARVRTLAKQLAEQDLEVDVIHGDLTQKERDKVMRGFKKERFQILIATDVAARGIDVEGLAYVVHDGLPDNAEWYTHRSGRTARAGKSGLSISFVHPKEERRLNHFAGELGISFEEY